MITRSWSATLILKCQNKKKTWQKFSIMFKIISEMRSPNKCKIKLKVTASIWNLKITCWNIKCWNWGDQIYQTKITTRNYDRSLCLRIDSVSTKTNESSDDVLDFVNSLFREAKVDIPESVIDSWNWLQIFRRVLK